MLRGGSGQRDWDLFECSKCFLPISSSFFFCSLRKSRDCQCWLYLPFCDSPWDKCRICCICVCVCVSVRVWPRRAVTVLNTLCKGQQVAMTSQGCQPSLPTTSYCPSWVRMPQSDWELNLHLLACTNPFKAAASAVRFHLQSTLWIAGRGFNNLSQVNMARYIPTGQLVAVKQTNLDECTEEELLQLMVSRNGNVFKGPTSWRSDSYFYFGCLKENIYML